MSVDKGFQDAVSQPQSGTSDGQSASIESIDIFRVGIKVPPFWAEEPDIWFAQVEGQFDISGITSDRTKFNYVIGQLGNEHAREVKDIIVNPPDHGRYEKLKTELIKRLSASKEYKIKQLLTHEELGDRKPSQFLRHLRNLAAMNAPDEFLKTIWVSRLPHGTQIVLAGQPATVPLEDLADLADRVHDIAPTTPRVASVTDAPGSVISELVKEVAELRKQFQNLSAGRDGRSRHRSPKSRRNRSTSRKRSQSNYRKFPVCWYHEKFGDKATKCVRPCDFDSAENSKGGR